MVPLKDAGRRREMARVRRCGDGVHVLVVRIAHPGEGAKDTDGHGEVGDNAHDQDRVVIVLVVDEDERYSEDEPYEAGCCAS